MTRTSHFLLLAVAFFSIFGTVTVSRANREALAIFNFRSTNMEAMGYNGEILFALLSALDHNHLPALYHQSSEDLGFFSSKNVQNCQHVLA
ncbi:MAG: hypothetical protein U9N60_09975 [Thermodesulfobacteriota bacterium]|nr:hypothetical protein [Thermodesulfobacteriota bacterium]